MTRVLNAARRAGNPQVSESIADQALNSVDTYLDGSILPFSRLDARTAIRWRFWANKTAAGVAAPSFKIRVGTKGDLTDAAKVTLVGPAQTAAVDTGYFELLAILRSGGAGSAAVLAALLSFRHNLDSTGFAVLGTPTVEGVSAGFDSTVRDQVIGLSIDPGAAAVWTVRGLLCDVTST